MQGLTPFWQGYGITLNRDDFTFYPTKVVEYNSSWRVALASGKIPTQPNEMMINSDAAGALAIELDDQLTVSGYGQKQTFHVVGIFQDPVFGSGSEVHTRFFVSKIAPGQRHGFSFATNASGAVPGELLSTAYQMKFNVPLLAEKVTGEDAKLSYLSPANLPSIAAVMIWSIEFLFILLMITRVMYHLVMAYPGSQIVSRSARFDHLDVYLNYSMLLILAAFFASSLVIGGYFEGVNVGAWDTMAKISGGELATIHLMSLGFWMTVFVIINWVLQRRFLNKRRVKAPSKLNLRSHKRLIDRSHERPVLKRILFILIANTLVGFLLTISLESDTWSRYLATIPSLWGFPNAPVSLNVTADLENEGFSFDSVIMEGAPPEDVRAVICESGFERFGIVLVAGRLPKWPNELIVGAGLANEGYGVGSTLRFYDQSGWHSGLVVGIGNALFDHGRIFGYIKASQKTFIFASKQDHGWIDFDAHAKDQLLSMPSNLAAYLTFFINCVFVIGVLTIGIFYTHAEPLLMVFRRHISVLHLSWLRITIALMGYGFALSCICFVAARLLWRAIPNVLLESIALEMGIVTSSMITWSPDSFLVVPILFVINFPLAYLVLNRGIYLKRSI